MGGRGRHRKKSRGGGAAGGGREHGVSLPMKRSRDDAGGRGGGGRGSASRSGPGYVEPRDRHSAALESYYREQELVPASEFPRLLGALATPLPSAFRVSSSSRFRGDILRKLTVDFPPLFDEARSVYEGAQEEEVVVREGLEKKVLRAGCDEPLLPPSQIAWYPEGLGWSVSTPRMMMRRDATLAPFQKWLVGMNDLGAVNRQEAVSMVPPLLIDIQPGQSVLDLCAAPGSKTAQLLEALSSGKPDELAIAGSGLVIANDVDIKRCWMLAHQLRRFGAPNLLVTNHDAQAFPSVIQFDRVLCDVPCTGDGTLRKSPDIFRKWNSQLGNGIHKVQKSILHRGVDLLKPGGRLVYSTCSMNPVENEAIVADALRHFGPGKLQLIDVSEQLPLLKRRPGLRKWKVKDNKQAEKEQQAANARKKAGATDGDAEKMNDADEGQGAKTAGAAAEGQKEVPDGAATTSGWFESFDQVPAGSLKIVESLFPPSKEELQSGNFPLERCIRLVPHDQDTGAFFVAVFIKPDVSDGSGEAALGETEISRETEKPEADAGGVTSSASVKAGDVDEKKDSVIQAATSETAGKGKHSGPKQAQHSRLITDDPLVGVDRVNQTDVVKIAEFFGLDEKSCRACLMTRGSEATNYKKLLLVTPAVRELLTMSIGSAEGKESGVRARLRIVNAGVRIFERTTRKDTVIPFRILSDALPILRTAMEKRTVTVEWDDLKLIMGQESVTMDELSPAARESIQDMRSGSVVVMAGSGADEELVVAWKGQYALSKLMPKEELAAIRTRHGLPEEVKKNSRKQAKDQPEQPEKESENDPAVEKTAERAAEEGGC